jgi:hypothetical protein
MNPGMVLKKAAVLRFFKKLSLRVLGRDEAVNRYILHVAHLLFASRAVLRSV